MQCPLPVRLIHFGAYLCARLSSDNVCAAAGVRRSRAHAVVRLGAPGHRRGKYRRTNNHMFRVHFKSPKDKNMDFMFDDRTTRSRHQGDADYLKIFYRKRSYPLQTAGKLKALRVWLMDQP
jgi:hypothetical protein